jgi:hypothetical protein
VAVGIRGGIERLVVGVVWLGPSPAAKRRG